TTGDVCLPGEFLRQSVIAAAKFHQDPQNPRKSAQSLFKAGLITLTTLAPVTSVQPRERVNGLQPVDYVDIRTTLLMRQNIKRRRPAMRAGWLATVGLLV